MSGGDLNISVLSEFTREENVFLQNANISMFLFAKYENQLIHEDKSGCAESVLKYVRDSVINHRPDQEVCFFKKLKPEITTINS